MKDFSDGPVAYEHLSCLQNVVGAQYVWPWPTSGKSLGLRGCESKVCVMGGGLNDSSGRVAPIQYLKFP